MGGIVMELNVSDEEGDRFACSTSKTDSDDKVSLDEYSARPRV